MDPVLLICICVGVIGGVLVGAVPGLTGAMAISLAVPLTFGMDPQYALALLVAMYVGSVSGGLITATLLRIPGTPASIITTLDGFPMAKGGRPGRALGLGITASLVGGLISWGVLFLLAKPLADWSTKMGPADMFSLVVVALVLIAVLSRESMIKGLFAGALGIFMALPGQHPALGQPRMTFGLPEMDAGFKLLPVFLGLFAVSQVLRDILDLKKTPETISVKSDSLLVQFREWKSQIVNLLRSSGIGSIVGVLPGIGANVGSILAYGAAKTHSSRRRNSARAATKASWPAKRRTTRQLAEHSFRWWPWAFPAASSMPFCSGRSSFTVCNPVPCFSRTTRKSSAPSSTPT